MVRKATGLNNVPNSLNQGDILCLHHKSTSGYKNGEKELHIEVREQQLLEHCRRELTNAQLR